MKNVARRHGGLIMAAILIAGCAATPTVRDGSLAFDASRYRSVYVRVERGERVTNLHGYDLTSKELLQAFLNELQASTKLVVGEHPVAGAQGLEVVLLITGFNYASGAERSLTGSFGSRALLNVTMTVSDREKKQPLGSASAGHASSRGQGVFSPTSGRQAEAIGKDLAVRLAAALRQ